MMTENNLGQIRKRFGSGQIKHQHLEAVVFKEMYDENPEHIRQTCRDAAMIAARQ